MQNGSPTDFKACLSTESVISCCFSVFTIDEIFVSGSVWTKIMLETMTLMLLLLNGKLRWHSLRGKHQRFFKILTFHTVSHVNVWQGIHSIWRLLPILIHASYYSAAFFFVTKLTLSITSDSDKVEHSPHNPCSVSWCLWGYSGFISFPNCSEVCVRLTQRKHFSWVLTWPCLQLQSAHSR